MKDRCSESLETCHRSLMLPVTLESCPLQCSLVYDQQVYWHLFHRKNCNSVKNCVAAVMIIIRH
jgi:hypothetical protein